MARGNLVGVCAAVAGVAALLGPVAGAVDGETRPEAPAFTNSIGMDFVRIEPGTYQRGSTAGFPDEEPVHEVTISKSFDMATTPVTNAQYEQFDPDHAELRGKLGWSTGDDEAVVFVSWHDAVAFTEWLSEKEGEPYRLATEAEWEYAARAGTTTEYWTGAQLPAEFHLNQNNSWFPGRDDGHEYVPLTVGQTPPNPWGLHDMHGVVEEWVLDWYGPYEQGPQTNPVGRVDGDFKIARGGSHSTTADYLRSATRMATLPEIRNWITGFRVVNGERPDTEPLPEPQPEPIFRDVSRDVPDDVTEGPDPDKPYFEGPRWYMNLNPPPPPEGDPRHPGRGPFYHHNHQPAITELPNGDLMAIWYTTFSESSRVLTQVGARLRYGRQRWDDASIFWDAPARNDHGNDLFWDGDGTVFHWTGLGAAGRFGALALVQRTSTDNGATWSEAELIQPEQGLRNQVIAGGIELSDGRLLLPADAESGGSGGTAVHLSEDGGRTWTDPGTAAVGPPPVTGEMHDAARPDFAAGKTGAWIAGIHAPVVELSDGRLMAIGRGNNIGGRAPMSISEDGGKTWTYQASEFPPVGGMQRAFLLKLKEGAIMFASLTPVGDRGERPPPGMTIVDAEGKPFETNGLYTAVSFDDGRTWPYKRLVTDDGPPRVLESMSGRQAVMSPFVSEDFGYLTATQARNGVIHLISSGNHYAFNLEWLTTPPPPPCAGTVHVGDVDSDVDDRRLVAVYEGDMRTPNRHGPQDACLSHMILDDKDWDDHGEFVEHADEVLDELLGEGHIDHDEWKALHRAAARSSVGR